MSLPVFQLPMPARRFMAEYWQKQPLLMRAAASGLSHPEPDLLAGLALDEAVEARLVEGGDNRPWRLHHGPFTEPDFQHLPAGDWTLLVQSVDCYLTEVSLLLDSFAFLPAWRLEDIMISYAAEGGGVGPHFDQYDVFLVQARGERRWRLGPHCDARTPLRDDVPLRMIADMPVSEDFTLGPGDVLYLPPGVAHWGTALDNDCVTWSVGLRSPSRSELLHSFAEGLLEQADDQPLGDPERQPARHPGRLNGTDSRRMLSTIRQQVRDPDLLDTAVGKLLSQPRQETLDFDVDLSHIRARAPESGLVRHGGTRLLLQSSRRGHCLWLNGQSRHLTPAQLPLARLLSDRRLISRAALREVLTAEAEALLEEWIHDGYFARL